MHNSVEHDPEAALLRAAVELDGGVASHLTRGVPPARGEGITLRDLESRYELCAVAIHHRVGRVEIGEASVVIAVSAPHRQAALAACKEAIDTLKTMVPLWKKEVYEGGEEWIGRGS